MAADSIRADTVSISFFIGLCCLGFVVRAIDSKFDVVFFEPFFHEVGVVEYHVAVLVDKELRSLSLATQYIVTLAVDAVFEVKPCTSSGDEGSVYNSHIAHVQRSIVTRMYIIDGSIDASILHDIVAYAREVAVERFAPVFEVNDIVAVRYYAHGVYLAEFDRYATDVGEFHAVRV